MWQLITVCISFLIFCIYNAAILIKFKPINVWSMSKSYYLLEDVKKGLGWLFTVFMWLMAGMLLPGWLEASELVGPWMNNFTFLSFITAAAIMFVGAAPHYQDDLEGDVHSIAAKISAGTALGWCFIVCWNIWYVPLIAMTIPAIVGLCIKDGWKECKTYWLEMMAFAATFGTIITEICLQLFG